MIKLKNAGKVLISYLIFFVASVILFSIILNQGKSSGALQDVSSGLPVIYVRAGGKNINEMHGYKENIDAGYFRDTVTPVADSSTVNFSIEEHDDQIVSASYELYNDQYVDLIESGECSELQKVDSMYQMKVQFTSTLRSNREYIMRIILKTSDKQEFNYYTRIRYGSDLKIAEKLDFIMDFNEATFDKDQKSKLSNYLETNSSSGSDLSHVSLYSTSDIVTWGSLAPKRISDLSICLKEINTETAAFTMTYSVQSDEDDRTTTYFVKEYYRLRWTDSKVYLLDFEREMQEDISKGEILLQNGAIRIGIQEIDALTFDGYGDEEQAYGYFLIGNQLWQYDSTNNICTNVYNGNDNYHNCSDQMQSAIKVIKADNNTGDIYFAVYGYMHQGDFEGQTGVMLYHYSNEEVSLEDIMFLPYNKGFAQLEAGIEKLAYMNDSDIFILIDDKIYRIEPKLGRLELAWSDLDSSSCAVSSDGILVLTEGTEGHPGCGEALRIIDLNTNKEKSFDVENMYITALGYMQTDLIYGIVDPKTVKEDSTGVLQIPITKVCIVDKKMNEIKSFQKDKIYVSGLSINDDSIELHLEKAVKNGSYTDYDSSGSEYIICNKKDSGDNVSMTSKKDSYRGYERWLQFSSTNTLYPICQTARHLDPGYDITKEIECSEEVAECYYIYTKGRLYKTFASLKEAVEYGNTCNSGATIMSSHKQIIWQKAGRAYLWDMDLEAIAQADTAKAQNKALLSAIASYEKWTLPDDIDWSQPVFAIMKEALPVDTIDLTGIALDDVLHFIYRDRFVVVKTDTDKYCLITGLDDNGGYLKLADPETGEVSWQRLTDVQKLIEENGNVFFSYID